MIDGTVARLWRAKSRSGLAGRLLGSVGVKSVGMLLAFGVNIYLARLLGPEQFGVYAFVYAVVTLLAIPVRSGLPTLVVRLVAAGDAKQEWGPVRGLFERASYFVFAVALAVAVTGYLLIGAYAEQIGQARSQTFMVAFVLLPLFGLSAVRAAALRGMRHVVSGLLPDQIIRPALFIVLLFIGTTWWGTASAVSAMELYAAAGLVAFVAGAVMLYRALPWEALAARPVYHTRDWLGSLVPLSILAGVGVINGQAGLVTLGLLGTDTDVGVFRVAERGATFVLFAFNAVNLVIAPYISRYRALNDQRRLRVLTAVSAVGGTTTALLVTATLVLFGEEVIAGVLGAEFRDAYTALSILSIGYVISAALGPVIVLLNMSGYERQTAVGMSIAAGLNVLLNLALVPLYGVNGAAMAMAVSTVAWSTFLCWKVRRELRIDPTIGSLRALWGARAGA